MKLGIYDDRLSLQMPGIGNIVVPTGHLAHTFCGSAAGVVSTSLRQGATHIAGMLADQDPIPKIQRQWVANFRPDAVQKTGIFLKALRTANEKRKADAASWLQSDSAPGDLRVATIVGLLQGRKHSEIIAMMHRSAETARIVFEFANEFNFDPASIPALERSIARAALVRSFEKTAAWRPSMGDPLGERPDRGYAEEMADKTIAANDAWKTEIDAGIRWIDSVCNFTAAMGNEGKATIFSDIASKAA